MKVKERFPEWFKENVEEMGEASKTLASKREIAFYGNEEGYLMPEELIGEKEAEDAVNKARKTYHLCKKTPFLVHGSPRRLRLTSHPLLSSKYFFMGHAIYATLSYRSSVNGRYGGFCLFYAWFLGLCDPFIKFK